MKEQKIHDINFLLRLTEQYLKKNVSEEVENTYQTLLSIKTQLLEQ